MTRTLWGRRDAVICLPGMSGRNNRAPAEVPFKQFASELLRSCYAAPELSISPLSVVVAQQRILRTTLVLNADSPQRRLLGRPSRVAQRRTSLDT